MFPLYYRLGERTYEIYGPPKIFRHTASGSRFFPGGFRVFSTPVCYTPVKTGAGHPFRTKGVFFMRDQTKALALYEEFQTKFLSNGSPAWFGGCWLEEDRLAVGVCGDGAPLDWMQRRHVKVQEAAWPESALQDLKNEVILRQKEAGLEDAVEAVWVDPRENCLRVVLNGPLGDIVPLFRERVSDSRAVLFEQDSLCLHADYHSGEICGCNTLPVNAHYGSIGYPAVDAAGHHGFVTAGHVVHGCQTEIFLRSVPGGSSGYIKAGTVTQEDDTTLDAAFVALDPGFGVKCTCPLLPAAPMVPPASDDDLPVGTAVELYSRHNPAQIITAIITASSADRDGGTDLYLLTRTGGSPSMVSGDSGSPVMLTVSHSLVGIYRGTLSKSGRLAVVKEKNIRAAFHVSLDASAPV